MKPLWKWCLGIAAGLLIILVFVNWYVNRRWQPRLEARLNALVTDKTDSLYRLAYDGMEISLLTGSATVTSVRLAPDTTMLERDGQGPDAIYRVRIARLEVGGLGVLRLALGGKPRIGSLRLDGPEVRITRLVPQDTASADTSDSFMAELAKTLEGVRLKRLQVNNGQLMMDALPDAMQLDVQAISADVRDVRIDSAALRDTARLYYAGAIRIDLGKVSYTTPDSLYRLRLGALHLATGSGELTLRELRYGLTVSKAEFYRRVKRAKDIADVDIGRLELTGLSVARWTKDGMLAATALHMDSGAISIYKDKLQPNPPENKIGKSPHQQLLSMEQPVAIDSIRVRALDIAFTEVSDQTGKAGTVTFDATDAVIRNVTNVRERMKTDRYLTLDARSKAMGTGDLSVQFRFDLLDSLGGHTYAARLGPMDGRRFNRMLTPHLNVEVENADIRGMRFEMAANDLRTEGTLQLDYRQLKMNLVEASGEDAGEKKPLISFFANRFLVNDSNPDANGQHHTGKVYIPRPKTFSFFKTIWRSIREGTKQCIGMGE